MDELPEEDLREENRCFEWTNKQPKAERIEVSHAYVVVRDASQTYPLC